MIPHIRDWLLNMEAPTSQAETEAYSLSLKLEPRDTTEALETYLMEEAKLRAQIQQLQIRVSDLEMENKRLNVQNAYLMDQIKDQQIVNCRLRNANRPLPIPKVKDAILYFQSIGNNNNTSTTTTPTSSSSSTNGYSKRVGRVSSSSNTNNGIATATTTSSSNYSSSGGGSPTEAHQQSISGGEPQVAAPVATASVDKGPTISTGLSPRISLSLSLHLTSLNKF